MFRAAWLITRVAARTRSATPTSSTCRTFVRAIFPELLDARAAVGDDDQHQSRRAQQFGGLAGPRCVEPGASITLAMVLAWRARTGCSAVWNRALAVDLHHVNGAGPDARPGPDRVRVSPARACPRCPLGVHSGRLLPRPCAQCVWLCVCPLGVRPAAPGHRGWSCCLRCSAECPVSRNHAARPALQGGEWEEASWTTPTLGIVSAAWVAGWHTSIKFAGRADERLSAPSQVESVGCCPHPAWLHALANHVSGRWPDEDCIYL